MASESPAPRLHPLYAPNAPLAIAAALAFILGITFGAAFFAFLVDLAPFTINIPYRLALYISSLAFFHWAEFAVTAGWNFEKCSIDSFLLNNGAMYPIAHGLALAEYLISIYFIPQHKTYPYVSQVGIVIVLVGQILRSTAMIHASTNFSHAVAFYKRDGHRLVTSGVYSWFRHPSYAGFYYWALGTQLLLQNPLSFLLFLPLLWKFFYYRIIYEEKALVKFFGNEYIEYRKRVGTKIPFVH